MAGANEKLKARPCRKVNGGPEARTYLMERKDLGELFAKWKAQCDQFKDERKKHLLY